MVGRTTMQGVFSRDTSADQPAHRRAPPINDLTLLACSGAGSTAGFGNLAANSRQATIASAECALVSGSGDAFAPPVTNASHSSRPESALENAMRSRYARGIGAPCAVNCFRTSSRIHETCVSPVASAAAPAPADQGRFRSTLRAFVRSAGSGATGIQRGHSNPSATLCAFLRANAISTVRSAMSVPTRCRSPSICAQPNFPLDTEPTSAQ